jgi:hypothetical protein
MADVSAAQAHLEASLKLLRETSAASFPETTVAKAILALEQAQLALTPAPAPAPAFTTGTPAKAK